MKKITNFFVTLMEKYLPDAFLFAVILTVIVYVATIIFTWQSPLTVLYSWNSNFWNLLSFAMQMAMIVVVGGALAKAPAFKKLMHAIASLAHNKVQAVIVMVVAACVTQWLQSGFSLVFCALLAREVARTVKDANYKLLVAAGYSGIAVCQCGVGGSILLTIAAEGGASAVYPDFTGAIPLSDTTFAPQTLICVALIIVVFVILFRHMAKTDENPYIVDQKMLEDQQVPQAKPQTPAEKLEVNKVLWAITWIAGLVIFVYSLTKESLSINGVIFLMLFVGILLHGNLKNYIGAFQESVSAAGPILLQFPFYAGIAGMMTLANADGVSLASLITNAVISISNERTLPVLSFLSAGILNVFIPSGGGQWAVQGPIILPAASEMGVPLSKVALGILWGDAWTNLIQPFWALPALGLAGLKARDIMGYLVVALIASGIIIACCLYFI